MSRLSEIFQLQKRERWFSASSQDGHDGIWDGPYKTLENAIMAQASEGAKEVWCRRGRYLHKDSRWADELEWECTGVPFLVMIPREHPIMNKWRCPKCNEFLRDSDTKWCWNGFAWEHHHEYPLGHVQADEIKE